MNDENFATRGKNGMAKVNPSCEHTKKFIKNFYATVVND
jgi:hypothetical protein